MWKVDGNGNCSPLLARFIVGLYRVMWGYHDRVHVHIFGRGDGGKLVFENERLV